MNLYQLRQRGKIPLRKPGGSQSLIFMMIFLYLFFAVYTILTISIYLINWNDERPDLGTFGGRNKKKLKMNTAIEFMDAVWSKRKNGADTESKLVAAILALSLSLTKNQALEFIDELNNSEAS